MLAVRMRSHMRMGGLWVVFIKHKQLRKVNFPLVPLFKNNLRRLIQHWICNIPQSFVLYFCCSVPKFSLNISFSLRCFINMTPVTNLDSGFRCVPWRPSRSCSFLCCRPPVCRERTHCMATDVMFYVRSG